MYGTATGAAMPGNNEASAELTTANGGERERVRFNVPPNTL